MSCNFGVHTSSNALEILWRRSMDRFSQEELEWFSLLGDLAATEIANLADVLQGIGCLVGNDEQSGAFRTQGGLSVLCFSLANQLSTIHGLIRIADDAGCKAKNLGTNLGTN